VEDGAEAGSQKRKEKDCSQHENTGCLFIGEDGALYYVETEGQIEEGEEHTVQGTDGDEETPNHYDCTIPPIEYIVANNLDFFEGNVIKYVTRHKKKNGLEDIKKAIHYLKMIAEKEYDTKL